MLRLLCVITFLLGADIDMSFAQQQSPDPAFLQKAVNALITQRNNALNAQADTEARLSQLADENAKLKAEIEALKKPPVEVEKK